MACGCSDNSCSCVLTGGTNVTVSGGGTAGNPFVINSASATPETAWTGTNADGGITITPGGTDGHAPVIDLNLDPDSPAALSVSGAGLSVACCGGGGGASGVDFIGAAPGEVIVIGDGTTGGDVPTILSPSFTLTGDGTRNYLARFDCVHLDMSVNTSVDPGTNLSCNIQLIDQSGPVSIGQADSFYGQIETVSGVKEVRNPIGFSTFIPAFTGTKTFNYLFTGGNPGWLFEMYDNGDPSRPPITVSVISIPV